MRVGIAAIFQDPSERSMHLFAKEVMPALQRLEGEPAR